MTQGRDPQRPVGSEPPPGAPDTRPPRRGPGGDKGPSRRAYELLLRIYPESFRRLHGDDWIRFVERQREEPRYQGRRGRIRFWAEVTLDAVASGSKARVGSMSTRMGGMMTGLWGEVRTVIRSLAREPLHMGLSLGTLAVGIGAAISIFSLADWVLLRPVPGVEHPDEAVSIRFQHVERPSGWFLVSHPDYRDLAERVEALDVLAGMRDEHAHVVLPGSGAPRRLPASLVTSGYGAALGLTPALGRVPEPEPGGDPHVVMLSHRLWRDAFGANPSVLGDRIVVNGRPFTVVGVGPRGFQGPEFPGRTVDMWMPVTAHPTLAPNYPDELLASRQRSFYFTLVGRLSPGADLTVLQDQLDAARNAILDKHGGESSLDRFRAKVYPGIGLFPTLRDRLAGTMRILAAGVAGLLLLACANAGNLLLGRGIRRRHELTVRQALGAGRIRLVRLLVVEGLLLGLAGGALGLMLALITLEAIEGQPILAFLPALEPVQVNFRIFAFGLAAATGTGVLFSLAPALVLSRASARREDAGFRVTRGGTRLRSILVVVQMGFSLALIVAAGLLVDTLRSLQGAPLGFDGQGVIEASLDPGTQGYDEDRLRTFWRELLARVRAAPEVGSAGLALAPLHGTMAMNVGVTPEGAPEDVDEIHAHTNYVSDGFLAAAGLELVEGRDFAPDEVLAEPPRDVIIVSRSLARELFNRGSAVGRRVTNPYLPDRVFEIVGVVADARVRSAKDESPYLVLEPLGQEWLPSWATLYARGRPQRTASTTEAIREAALALDSDLPLYDVQPMGRRLAHRMAEERILARLTTVFAALALFLATVGLYGVMSQATTARRKELGIRIALGAPGSTIQAILLKQGLRTTAVGLTLGAGLGYVATLVVSSRLWGVEPLNPRVLGLAILVLVSTAMLACWLPARRAARTDPVEVLGVE